MIAKIFLFLTLYYLITLSPQNIFASVYTEESHYANRCITFIKDDRLTKDGVNIIAIITSPLIDFGDPDHTERRVVLPGQCLKRKEVMPSSYDIFRIYSTLEPIQSYVEKPDDLIVEVKNVTGEYISNNYQHDEELVEYSYAGIIEGKPKFYRSKIIHRLTNRPESSEAVSILPNPYANIFGGEKERGMQYPAKLLSNTPTSIPTVVKPTIKENEVVHPSENIKQLAKSSEKKSNLITTWLCQVFGKFIKSCNQKPATSL